jgi:hypothetical protein
MGMIDVTERDLRQASLIQQVVDALAAGRTIKDACIKVGIDEKTWRNWRRDGLIQEHLNLKFQDIQSGVRDLIADSMVKSVKVLCSLAKGVIPPNTSIDGVLAARDVVAAGKAVNELWKDLGGTAESKEREQERIIEELAKAKISITQIHVQTVNIGTEAQPMPVPVGAGIIDGEVEEV